MGSHVPHKRTIDLSPYPLRHTCVTDFGNLLTPHKVLHLPYVFLFRSGKVQSSSFRLSILHLFSLPYKTCVIYDWSLI